MPLNYGYNPNPYGNGNVNPTVPYLPTYGQPMQQNNLAQNVNWIYVNGVQGAREHIVQPGNTAWLMDNNEPIIYVKAVDNVGSSTLRAFKLLEIPANSQGTQITEANTSQYVTKDEFAALSQRLEKFISEMGGLTT